MRIGCARTAACSFPRRTAHAAPTGCALSSCQPLLDLLDRVDGDDDVVGRGQRDRIDAVDIDDVDDVLVVARGEIQLLVHGVAHDQRAAVGFDRVELADQRLGLRRVDREFRDHLQAALAIQFGQHRAQRAAVHLAIDLLREVARLRRERARTTDEDRRTVIAVAGTAALLLLELLGGARDAGVVQLRLGTGAARVAVSHHHLMHEILAERGAEDRFGNLQGLSANHIQFHGQAPQALAAGRTTTSPPVAPGTAPLTAIRWRSASTLTTSRFIAERLTLPMWPAIFLPGNTRPGVWRWPIEPGARCDSELPCVASPIVKFQRLIVPWKPLPLVTPATSTICPTLNTSSALISAPTAYLPASASDRRNSHRPRPGSTFALAKWPLAGLPSNEARLAPTVTCTAA